MSALTGHVAAGAVQCGATAVDLGIVTLPDRHVDGQSIRLVRIRTRSRDVGTMSARMGRQSVARLIGLLTAASAAAWPAVPAPAPDSDASVTDILRARLATALGVDSSDDGEVLAGLLAALSGCPQLVAELEIRALGDRAEKQRHEAATAQQHVEPGGLPGRCPRGSETVPPRGGDNAGGPSASRRTR